MKVRSFVVTVCLTSAVTTALVWRFLPPSTGWSAGTVATLALLALAAELMAFVLPRGASGSISFVPFMTAVLLVPNVAALLPIGFARVVSGLVKRTSADKLVFNTSQVLIAYAAALFVYTALGGRSIFALHSSSVAEITVAIGFPMLAAYTVTFAANSLLVSRVIGLSTGERTLSVWRENHLSTIGLDILATPLVFAFALLYARYGPMAAAGFWMPILGLRQLNTTNLELAQTNRELLELMVKSIEARDPYTSGHSRRVREYALAIARVLGISSSESEKIGTAALLHDVGKIYDKYASILAKEERLTPSEWAIIKEHPADGANLIATMTRLREMVPAVRHHHENWDGSGYPDGLKGQAIPLASRIIMFADTFDAMTTKRPYRGPLGEEQVRAELIRCRGRQFDPTIADRLLASNFWDSLFPPVKSSAPRPRFLRVMAGGVRR